MEDFFTQETKKIREMISSDPSYSELSDEQLKERAEQMLELRMKQVQQEEPETAGYYSSLSFRGRKKLSDTVFESLNSFRTSLKVRKGCAA